MTAHARPAARSRIRRSYAAPELRGGRVRLRRLTRADALALGRALRDPSVVRFLPPRVRRETGAQFVARVLREQRRGAGVAFAILSADGEEVMGQVRLIDWSHFERRAEVGIWLRRKYWGRGNGAEALALACRYGFRSMGLHRISAAVVAGNLRSAGMLARVGFRREGRLRSMARAGSAWRDTEIFGLLRGELRPVSEDPRRRRG